jgi:NAD(P)-dependent dehydrogenase (short-subunit alcohol dehydrogenase family)
MSFVEKLFSLEGRHAVVTGAAHGNGRAIAEALGRAGAELALIDRDEAALGDTTKEMRELGLELEGMVCDLHQASAIAALSKQLSGHWDAIDVLVNNAGITVPCQVESFSLDAWETTLSVNLRAPFLLVHSLLPLLKRGVGKTIINITSLNAELAFPGNPAYVASKGGLRQLTKALALDLGRYGIRVNAIGPGYIRTAMTEKSWSDPDLRSARADRTILDRWGEPEDLAGAALFLASPASAYVTGITIYVDGGWLAKGL